MKNIRQIGLLLLLLVFFHNTNGQDKDLINKLEQELNKQQTDTGKIRLNIAIADQYATSDTKKALTYIDRAKKIIPSVDCRKCNADILHQEAIVLTYSSNYSAALDKFEKAMAIYRQLENKSQIAWCCLWIGAIHGESLNYNKTLNYYSEARELFKSLNDNDGIAYCYYQMATVYAFQNKSKMAIEYDLKAIELANKKDKQRLAKFYLSLFRDYKTEGEYDKALSLVDSIIPAFKKVNNLYLLGKSHCYLGCVYLDLGDYKKAEGYIKTAIDYDYKFGNKHSLMITKMNLSQVYIESNQLDSAISVLKDLLILNKQLKNIKYDDMIYYNMFIVYEKKGDFKSAYEYCIKFMNVNDSVVEDLTNQRLLELQTKYEVNLKNEQIKLLEKEKQLVRQKYISFGTGLILLLIVSLYVISYKNRKAKEKQLLHEAEIKEAENKHQAELQEATSIIETKQRELTTKAIYISQQGQILSHVKEQLENVKNDNPEIKETILGILSNINIRLNQNAFSDFEKYFIEVHPKFYDALKQKYPDLSQNELKVCALLRLNLNTKQIADITGRSVRSVESTRTTIRKKMELELQDNLFEKISTI
jgi:tetratricopeptide (TPR) repeat protein